MITLHLTEAEFADLLCAITVSLCEGQQGSRVGLAVITELRGQPLRDDDARKALDFLEMELKS